MWLSHVSPDVQVGYWFSKYGLRAPGDPLDHFRDNQGLNHFHSHTIILFAFFTELTFATMRQTGMLDKNVGALHKSRQQHQAELH